MTNGADRSTRARRRADVEPRRCRATGANAALARAASRSSTPTGSATRPARRRASTRTSGAGTRPASRSAYSALRPGPRRDRAALALRGPVAQRPAAAHPLHRRRPLLPGAGVLADRAARRTPRRSRRRRGSSSRPCTRPRVWQVYRHARGPRAGGGVPARAACRELVAWHDYLYRERTRDGEGLVEIWHPWESGMDNSPLWDEALARIAPAAGGDPRLPARRHRGRRLVAAADERRVRPLRVPRQALPRRRLRPGADPRRVPVRRSRTSSSTRCSSRRTAISRRSRASSATTRSRSSVRPTARREPRREALGRAPRHVPRLRPARGRAHPAPAPGRGLAPLYCRRAARRARRADCSRTVREFAVDARRRLGASPSVAADDPSFDPARYWRGPVWPMINWVIHLGLAPVRLRRRGGAAPRDPARARPRRRLLGALQREDRRGAGHGAPVLDRRARARPATRPTGRHTPVQYRASSGERS